LPRLSPLPPERRSSERPERSEEGDIGRKSTASKKHCDCSGQVSPQTHNNQRLKSSHVGSDPT
jgi:hypothetical protein